MGFCGRCAQMERQAREAHRHQGQRCDILFSTSQHVVATSIFYGHRLFFPVPLRHLDDSTAWASIKELVLLL